MAKLPKLSPEDLEKVRRLKGETGDVVIERELYLLAEFGYYLGWDAILAVEMDVISMERMESLVVALRKVHNDKMYEQAGFDFYSSKGSRDFNKGINKVKSKARVD